MLDHREVEIPRHNGEAERSVGNLLLRHREVLDHREVEISRHDGEAERSVENFGTSDGGQAY